MAITETKWSALPVPYAVEYPDRVPKQRYYDADFYQMEAELLWPRVWQMACRLEEVPEPGDFVEYEILDQSIVVVRTEAMEVKAYYNACRHRGVKLVEGRGNIRGSGFICSFHGWCYGLDGANTFLYQPDLFAEQNRCPGDLALTPVRCETWGGCAWINLDDQAPPLRDCIEPFASIYDAWKVESLRVEWWLSCRMPTNWKLAMEAFMEGYHVMQTHPQLNPPGLKRGPETTYRQFGPDGKSRSDLRAQRIAGITDSRTFIDTSIHYMRTLSDGMAGMIHANEFASPRDCATSSCPPTPKRPGRPGSGPSMMPSWPGTRQQVATSPTSTSSPPGASPIRCTSASLTTSCSRASRAPPRTGSVPWAPRSASSSCGR